MARRKDGKGLVQYLRYASRDEASPISTRVNAAKSCIERRRVTDAWMPSRIDSIFISLVAVYDTINGKRCVKV